MKNTIDQLRAEQERLRTLISRTEDAVRGQKHEAIRSGAQTVAATVLARISFHRAAVLPELSRQDLLRTGPVDGAARMRLFSRELDCIEKPLRELMAPFNATPSDRLARAQLIDAWSVVRDAVDALLNAEGALLDEHSTRAHQERRQTQRIGVECHATVLSPEEVHAKVVDLSLGGAFLEVPEPLPHVGRLLNVRFFLAGLPLPIATWCEVRRHAHEFQKGRSAIGLRFVDLPANAKLAISTFLAGAALKREPKRVEPPAAASPR